jgi:hypothetical protein
MLSKNPSISGSREQIDSEKNGLIVGNDENSPYSGLKRLLLEEALRNQFTEELRGFVYDNEAIYEKIEQVLFP